MMDMDKKTLSLLNNVNRAIIKFILFPDSPAPSACAFSLLASAHST